MRNPTGSAGGGGAGGAGAIGGVGWVVVVGAGGVEVVGIGMTGLVDVTLGTDVVGVEPKSGPEEAVVVGDNVTAGLTRSIGDAVLVVTTVEPGALVGEVDTDSRSESSNALLSSEPQPATSASAPTARNATRRLETNFMRSG